MKLLITGAQGQVGSELVTLGRRAGFNIHASNRIELDITNEVSVAASFKKIQPDIVINAAAYTAVDLAEQEQDQAYAINAKALENLLQHCRQNHTPLFHISTDYVFDGEKEQAYVETDQPKPVGVYGASKLAGERIVQQYEQHIILRVAWVFGAEGNNFVKSMLRLGKERENLGIVNDQHGGPTWSNDIASVLLDLA